MKTLSEKKQQEIDQDVNLNKSKTQILQDCKAECPHSHPKAFNNVFGLWKEHREVVEIKIIPQDNI